MDSVRDLGIRVDSDLSFRSPVRYVETTSKSLINLCFKMFTACRTETFLSFYKLYVLPVITYGSSIYSLVSVSNTLIPNYADRLGFFRLDPLEIHLIKKD